MKNENYSIAITVNATPQETFNCINRVSEWWTENLEGHSQHLNDEFTVRFDDVHVSKQKLIEVIPDKKVVWLVTESQLNFIENKREWTGTKICFEISEAGKNTVLHFTHEGLVPEIECFKVCSDVWQSYVKQSLANLIHTGKGQPTGKKK